MNDRIRRRIEMLNRVDSFGKAHVSDFPAGSRGAALFAIVQAVLQRIQDQSTAQEANRTTTIQRTLSKGLIRDRLIQEMDVLDLTARAMVGQVAGLEEKFHTPHNPSDQGLMTVARVFAQDALTFKDDFTQRGLPTTFIDDLNALIDEYSEAINDRAQSADARVAATVRLLEAVEEAIAAVRELNAIVRNTLRDDRGALAEWQSASHIERAPRHQPEEPPAPPSNP